MASAGGYEARPRGSLGVGGGSRRRRGVRQIPARRCRLRRRTQNAFRGSVAPAGDTRAERPAGTPAARVGALGVAAASAADDDPILLDLDLDRTMPGPVLGVDRVLLDGGVQPQAVALLAVIECPLERARVACR